MLWYCTDNPEIQPVSWVYIVGWSKAFNQHAISARVAVPLSVDVKGVALVPNPASGLAVKVSFGPQTEEDVLDVCTVRSFP